MNQEQAKERFNMILKSVEKVTVEDVIELISAYKKNLGPNDVPQVVLTELEEELRYKYLLNKK